MTRFIFRVIISFLILLGVVSFITPAHAQTQSQFDAAQMHEDVPKNLHTWSQTVMIEVLSSVVCQLSGIDPAHPKQPCLAADKETGNIGYAKPNGGAVGMMTNMIGVLYTPPINSGEYYKDIASNFGIVKAVHAQGIGFAGISPLQKIWATFRDIVYLLFVLLFIIVGLAIMLRIKIDPRTVMSIENSIPKLIIGLLMVTFSFAISGLLIDFMWITTYVTTNVLTSTNKVQNTQTASVVNKNIYSTPFGMVNDLYSNVSPFVEKSDPNDVSRGFGSGIWNISQKSGLGVKQAISSLTAPNQTPGDTWNLGTTKCSGFDPGCWATSVVGATLGNILGQVFAWLISWIFGILAILVVLVAILYSLFKLWFTLISAYIYILIDIVLAPFWMLGDIIPGSPINFGAWLRDMLAHLSVFPVTIAMFLLGRVFMDSFSTASTGEGAATLFVPPLIGTPNEGPAIGALIGMGIILLTPQVVTIMRDLFKAPEFKYSAAIGQAVGLGAKAVGAGPGKGWEFLTREADPYKHKSAGLLRSIAFNKVAGDSANARQNQGGWRNKLAYGLFGPDRYKDGH